MTKKLDSFIKADLNGTKNLKSTNRDGYMPNITTPDFLKSGVYGGLGLSSSFINAKNNYIDLTNSMLDLSVLAGYNINQYLAAESRAMLSIAYDNSIDYKSVSLFLKPQYEVFSGLDIYSLIGFGKVSMESVNSDKTKSSKTSMQIGLGANYKLKDNFKIFADYTYLGKDGNAKFNNTPVDVKSSAMTAGITYDF